MFAIVEPCLQDSYSMLIKDMTTVYDYILNIDAKTVAHMEKIGARLKIDHVLIFQLADSEQTIKHIWPETKGDASQSIRNWSGFSIEADLPAVYLRLKSLVPFFDPLEALPAEQNRFLQNLGAKAAIFIPIQYTGSLWGFLCCISDKSKRSWKGLEISQLMMEVIDITYNIMLRETLSELKDNDEHLRFMLNYILDGVVTIDTQGIITNVSGYIAELGGYSMNELLGKSIRNFIHQDDWGKIERNLSLARERLNDRIMVDYRLILKTGQVFWTRSTTIPLMKQGEFKGFVILISKIDDYIKSEEQLHIAQEVLSYTNELIWITDNELLLKYVSPSLERLLGYTKDEALRLNLGHTVSRKTLTMIENAFREGMAALIAGNTDWKTVLPVEQFHRNGSKLNGEMLLAIHKDRDGKAKGFIGITHFAIKHPFSLFFPGPS
jgi:PAS domain S-box-containing protein